MTKVYLGTAGDRPLTLDVDRLIESKLLIQANTGGYFSNSIGPLATLGLIERSRGTIRPTPIMFPEQLV